MAAIMNFSAIIKGDTFRRRTVQIMVDGLPMDLTGAEICAQIVTKDKNVVFKMPTEITATYNGEVALLSFDVNLHAHAYEWEFKITTSEGTTLTYLVGDFHVLNSAKCQ